jgi:putative ABC transport system permease protein
LPTDTTARALRAALATADPGLAVFDIRRMQDLTDLSLALRRGVLTAAVVFALTALALATLGLYGVLAYLVAERKREIGIRMALDGTLRDIVRLILREGGALSGIGVMIGLAASVGLSGAIRDQLYQVHPLNSVLLSMVAVLVGTIALIACMLPARRASRVNPAIVLAQE